MKSLYIFCMYFLFATVLVHQLVPIPNSFYVIASSFGLILFLCATLCINRGFMQIASIVALAAGHLLIFRYDLSFAEWHNCLTKGILMPLLFVVIPLISIPISNGGYLESMEHFVAERRNRCGQVFLSLAVIHLALTVALNIASIIIFQRLLDPLNLPRKYLARLHIAVYSSNMMFSPYDPALNMILLYQNVSYADYFLPALILVTAIVGLCLLFVLMDKKLLQDVYDALPEVTKPHSLRKLIELMTHVLTLIILAFLGSLLMPDTPTIFIVSGIIVIYSLVWIFLVGTFDDLKQGLRKYNKNFDDYIQFLPFLIALSFFGSAVSLTPIRDYIGEFLMYLNGMPLYFVGMSFMVFVAGLSFCGIHMIIPVTTLALTVSPETLNLTPVAFLALLMVSWVAGMTISPLIPFTVVTSSAMRVKATTLAYRWGLGQLLPWVLIAPMLIIAINYVTGPT
ncbi:MAG: hypothetical protein HKP41_23590 [Desulfobacterales bacterium]|nr:hypothetical protein [Desulfobacterales bacterium]